MSKLKLVHFFVPQLITSVVVVVVNVVIPIIAIIAAGAEWLGLVCAVFTTVMYVSPLATMVRIESENLQK